MQILKLADSTAARRRVFLHLVDATDGYTPETGEAAGQPQLSKNGGTLNNTSATLVAVGNGAYYVELTTGELDTLGPSIVRYKSANTREFQDVIWVVAFDPFDATYLGLSYLAVLGTAIPEITGPVTATPTPQSLFGLLVAAFRNKLTATSTALKLHKDDNTEVAKYDLTDDGTTFTRAKQASP